MSLLYLPFNKTNKQKKNSKILTKDFSDVIISLYVVQLPLLKKSYNKGVLAMILVGFRYGECNKHLISLTF